LYLPKERAEDSERWKTTEVLEDVRFHSKPKIALDQIRAVAAQAPRGVVLADAAYGINTDFTD
jgi:SRSO17 transposase